AGAGPSSRIAEFTKAHDLRMPILLDSDQSVADRFTARCTPEAFVLDQQRIVRYRGRIDDQYRPGVEGARASRADLDSPIAYLLAGKPVSVPVTQCAGCTIT